jgi:hypothetical protein
MGKSEPLKIKTMLAVILIIIAIFLIHVIQTYRPGTCVTMSTVEPGCLLYGTCVLSHTAFMSHMQIFGVNFLCGVVFRIRACVGLAVFSEERTASMFSAEK